MSVAKIILFIIFFLIYINSEKLIYNMTDELNDFFKLEETTPSPTNDYSYDSKNLSQITDANTFWINNYEVIFMDGNYTKFIPKKNMTYIEKLNSLSRLAFYFFIVLLLFGDTNHENYKWIFIPVLILLTTLILFKLDEKEKNMKKEKEEHKKNITVEKPNITPEETYKSEKKAVKECLTCKTGKCRESTKNNPFMNVLLTDFEEDPQRPEACDLEDTDIMDKAYDGFYEGLYRDVSDVFEQKNSQRTYYTTPSTTIPNDTKSFAEWLYGVPETCKTDNNFCNALNNIDLRQASRKEFLFS